MKTKEYKSHPLQSSEWAEFRKKMGVKIIEEDKFVLSIHKIPYTSWAVGYLPRGPMPTQEMLEKLQEIGIKEKCIFIQIEPNVKAFTSEEPVPVTSEVARQRPRLLRGGSLKTFGLRPSFHPLFTRYTFILDLTKSEEELLRNMHPKTRYNIKIAQKHNVKIIEDNSDKAFDAYLKLTAETTKRQGFYAHTENYHRAMWETLKVQSSKFRVQSSYDKLTAHLLLANYPTPLVAWILFVFQDTLYYPYGASSSENRETMASNLMMWEAIKFGKKLGLKKFDMWGSLGPAPSSKDPWYGFHRFKQGYGGELVEFIGSYDLIINPILYQLYKIADKIRWLLLRIRH